MMCHNPEWTSVLVLQLSFYKISKHTIHFCVLAAQTEVRLHMVVHEAVSVKDQYVLKSLSGQHKIVYLKQAHAIQ